MGCASIRNLRRVPDDLVAIDDVKKQRRSIYVCRFFSIDSNV